MVPPGVDIVRVPLVVDDRELARLHSWLAPDERDRARRLLPIVRRRFVACRGRLRAILGGLVGVRPADVRFRYGPRGKPELADGADDGWRFNLSHSGDVALVALAHADVGIDVEIESPSHDSAWADLVAPSILAAGEFLEWAGSLPEERVRSLLAAWVAKEAVLKAEGQGIGDGPRRIIVCPSPPEVVFFPGGDVRSLLLRCTFDDGFEGHSSAVGPPAPSRWRVCNLQIFPGEHAALACEAAEIPVRILDYRSDAAYPRRPG